MEPPPSHHTQEDKVFKTVSRRPSHKAYPIW